MKKFELIFTFLLLPLDYAALLLAGTLAYFLRFETFVTEIRPVIFAMSYQDFFAILALVSVGWLAIFAFNGLYSITRETLLNIVAKIAVASSAATLIIVVAFFFNFQLFSSRIIILTGWLLGIILVSAERIIIHYVKKIFYGRGIGSRQVVLIGKNNSTSEIAEEFAKNPSFGFKIIRRLNGFKEEEKKILAQLLVQAESIDDVILADSAITEQEKNELVNFCLDHQLNYKYAASLLETKLINFSVSSIAGIPLIEVKQTSLDGWGRILKRIFDLLAGLVLLIILSPLLILIGLMVTATSRGPVIVKLTRIGYGGKSFALYKFRSMINNAHSLKKELLAYNERNDGPLFKMTNDPRITPVGRLIRRFSLDELPQLVNVLWGQMSLVGPRPHEPEEVARYQTGDKRLLFIKPGMTGLAQVSGRSDLNWQDEVKLDSYYLENWRPTLDLSIILKTPKAVFGKRRAM